MREKLAVARAYSKMDTVARGAFGSRAGGLWARAIDNGDRLAKLEVKGIIAIEMTRKHRRASILDINKVFERVFRYLSDGRCQTCKGQKEIAHPLTKVVRPCPTCDASGFSSGRPTHWDDMHEEVLRQALGDIKHYLQAAREG